MARITVPRESGHSLTMAPPVGLSAPVRPAPELSPIESGIGGIGGQPLEIECPLTGEIVDADDVDGMIDLYESLKSKNDRIYSTLIRLRVALASLTEGDAKTRRIAGNRRTAKVEMPSDSYDGKMLRQAWDQYEEFRDDYLKIESIGVQGREVKKLVNTTGTDELNAFRDLITKANRGPTGTPTITVER